MRRYRSGIDFDRRRALVAAAGCAFGATLPGGALVALVDPEVSGYADVPGGRIWYRINGADLLAGDRAPLVVLHGGPGSNHRGFTRLSALSDERAVILYDQLDSGHSDRPGDPTNWTTARFASEIPALRSALSLDRCILLGHSAGASWAATYALQDPSGLEGLVLSSPLLSTKRWLDDAAHLRSELPPGIQDVLNRNEREGTTDTREYQEAVREFSKRHLCRTPCDVGDLGNDRPSFNIDLYNYMWGPTEFIATGTLRDFDLTDRLHQIKAPVAIMCGEFDEARPTTCEYFASLIPGARFHQVDGAAHTGYITQTDRYVELLRQILRFFDAANGR